MITINSETSKHFCLDVSLLVEIILNIYKSTVYKKAHGSLNNISDTIVNLVFSLIKYIR